MHCSGNGGRQRAVRAQVQRGSGQRCWFAIPFWQRMGANFEHVWSIFGPRVHFYNYVLYDSGKGTKLLKKLAPFWGHLWTVWGLGTELGGGLSAHLVGHLQDPCILSPRVDDSNRHTCVKRQIENRSLSKGSCNTLAPALRVQHADRAEPILWTGTTPARNAGTQ